MVFVVMFPGGSYEVKYSMILSSVTNIDIVATIQIVPFVKEYLALNFLSNKMQKEVRQSKLTNEMPIKE